MPIHESDPWRLQYFSGVDCPPDVHIPTDDALAFELNPRHRWIYDKFLVAQSQGLKCGLYGTRPTCYPVFKKPVTNLQGMGMGTAVLRGPADYDDHCREGDFWTTLLTGDHVSTDFAVVRGKVRWCRHAHGIASHGGMFDYWVIQGQLQPELARYCADWVARYLPDYSGMLNIETIGGRIIEVHLRFADQWPDLYEPGWLDAVVRLYQQGDWLLEEAPRVDGYSLALFGPHSLQYSHPPQDLQTAYQQAADVTSVQITFSENLLQSAHAMPPGGFRLAIVNCMNLDAGIRLRTRMARDFGLVDSAELRAPMNYRTTAMTQAASATEHDFPRTHADRS